MCAFITATRNLLSLSRRGNTRTIHQRNKPGVAVGRTHQVKPFARIDGDHALASAWILLPIAVCIHDSGPRLYGVAVPATVRDGNGQHRLRIPPVYG